MALLRNLRNIVKSDANIVPVLNILSNAENVRKSKQLPFRFYSAYRTLSAEGLMTPEIHAALESAISHSIENLGIIPGRTLIAVDVSYSMNSPISERSQVRCCDIATLFGAMANRICEDATVCYFDSVGYSSLNKEGYRIEHYGKFDSILEICKNNSFGGGNTDLSLPMKYALEDDLTKNIKPFDRVIYFSDNECNSSYRGLYDTVQGMTDRYRTLYNKDFWVHGVDLEGYGTQQFCGNKFNLIAGWSETVLEFINLAEAGISTLVQTIDNYTIS